MPTRRAFISRVALGGAALAVPGCGGGMAGPDGGGSGGPVTLRVALPAVGATINVPGGANGQGIAVTRLSSSAVAAVSRRCTHQGCTVGLPLASLGNMQCPCHGSVFTVTGSVVNGPAASPLLTYPTTIDFSTNEVVITVA
jgi:cytochrome b6-f complex iron-sulfur subunit